MLIPSIDSKGKNPSWASTWLSCPTGLPPTPESSNHTIFAPTWVQGTVRYRLRLSLGGSQLRIRLSNDYGKTPQKMAAVSVGLAGEGLQAIPGTITAVTFAGKDGVSIPESASALTDPIALPVQSLSDLVVSTYFPDGVNMLGLFLQDDIGLVNGANLTLSETLPAYEPIAARPVVSAIDVLAEGLPRVVVAFGDSITDGGINPDSWERGWPGALSRRLTRRGISVVNAGIAGNRLLGSTDLLLGKAALARMDQDVLSVSGLTHIVVLLGTNDIGHGGLFENAPMVQADELLFAYYQIVIRAHARGIKVVGCTLPPFAGSGFDCEEKEAVRQAVNQWIRSSNAFDGLVDFDKALRDPSSPGKLLEEYDSGDRLHPSFLGYQAMADAVDETLFT